MKRTRKPALALLFLAADALAAGHEPPTLGEMTWNNQLSSSGWLGAVQGVVEVSTPSILQVQKSEADKPDPAVAILNYDRVVDLHADPAIRAEAMRRSADLRLQLFDNGTNTQPQQLQKAIDTYKALAAEQPDYGHLDEVLYQLARAQSIAGKTDDSVISLRQLGQARPASPLAPEAHFRAAEQLFLEGRYDQSELEYRAVVDLGPDGSFFESSQYKYGWSLYKQAKFSEAVPVFTAILERLLPPGDYQDRSDLATVPKAKAEMVSESLRMTGLSFAALGGGKAINDYLGAGPEPRFAVLLYAELGATMLDKKRYSDSANAYLAFVERHPSHPLAPRFQARAVAAYRDGGFAEQVAREEGRYVETYAPGAPYWSAQGKAGDGKPTGEVVAELHHDLDDLGPYYRARAQKLPEADPSGRQADFLTAATWYRKALDVFPQDSKAPDANLSLADSLLDGGKTQEAAQEYQHTAYGYKDYARAPDAAYAGIQAYQRLAKEAAPADRPAALKLSVDASLKLADSFPAHPQLAAVLTRASEDLFEANDLDRAIGVANRVLAIQPPPEPALRSQALGVVADSRFAQNKFPEAEKAYGEFLQVATADDPQRKSAYDRLAASIYKQGQAARDAGDLRTAAADFLRVGQATPDAGIRVNADYDAASAFYSLKDWPASERALEDYRNRYPDNPLVADADKMLAPAYQNDNKPAAAAEVYGRISQRGTESVDNRRDANWLAAQLYDKANQPLLAAPFYESFVAAYPQQFDQAMEARRRLADIALDNRNDDAAHLHWLQEIVAADSNAGSRSDSSRLMAAQATLEIGRSQAAAASAVALTEPLNSSLPQRKSATEQAITTLGAAANYGFAEVTTAATFEIGEAYRAFGRALLDSQRPAKLQGDALAQYNELLEEQADPFEQKAIDAYMANVQRIGNQGVWNDWIHKSAVELAEMAPAKYGKHEMHEDSYESLR